MLGILRRVFSFQDWTLHHPDEPPPGDMLDASFDAQNARISELEQLVSRILRSDGALQNETVSWDSLTPAFFGVFEQKLKDATDQIVDRVFSLMEIAQKAEKTASEAQIRAVSASAFAEMAKTEVDAASSAAIAQISLLNSRSDQVVALLEDASAVRTDWDDAEASAQAWADSSRLWAEHMPDTLPDNALKIMDVSGDHWSSRWWANQAANAFGMLTSLYLGVHAEPPVTNANGGPIETGSIYYDSDDHQPYVWTGSTWEPFYAGTNRSGLTTLWYEATAGQTVFPLTVADLADKTWSLDPDYPEQLDVHVNGIRLMPDADYTITVPSSTITVLRPLRAGDHVAIDVLMPVEKLSPGAVLAYALKPLTGQDGSKTVFDLETKETPGVPVAVVKYEELLVSLDGAVQEPGLSYTALGATITFVQAPSADAHVFITWLSPSGGGGATGGSGIPEAPVDGQQYARQSANWSVVEAGGGVPEAPTDGFIYARQSSAWVDIPGIGGISPTEYNYNASATVPPPNTNNMRLNNASQTAATQMFIHHTNAMNVDVSNALRMIQAGNTLLLQDKTNAANYQYYTVSGAITDFATYTTVPIAWASGGSPCSAGRVMLAAFGMGGADEVIGGIITIGSTPPASPAVNDVWIDTT